MPDTAEQARLKAMTAAADGTYPYSQLANSRPLYRIQGAGDIRWDGVDRWECIDENAEPTSYYYSLDDVATPDLCTTWVAGGSGSNPVPTVTAGANPTFDVDIIYYDVAI